MTVLVAENSSLCLIAVPKDFLYSVQESEWPYCQRHWRGDQKSDETGWAEMEASLLPCVKVVFSQFSANIKTLLASHNNKLPLSRYAFFSLQSL